MFPPVPVSFQQPTFVHTFPQEAPMPALFPEGVRVPTLFYQGTHDPVLASTQQEVPKPPKNRQGVFNPAWSTQEAVVPEAQSMEHRNFGKSLLFLIVYLFSDYLENETLPRSKLLCYLGALIEIIIIPKGRSDMPLDFVKKQKQKKTIFKQAQHYINVYVLSTGQFWCE